MRREIRTSEPCISVVSGVSRLLDQRSGAAPSEELSHPSRLRQTVIRDVLVEVLDIDFGVW